MSALSTQVAGDHYKRFEYQPAEFLQDAGLGWCESNVIKYVARHRFKNGAQDLDKAIHYLQILQGAGEKWRRPKAMFVKRFIKQFTGIEHNVIKLICSPYYSIVCLIEKLEKLKNDVYRPF